MTPPADADDADDAPGRRRSLADGQMTPSSGAVCPPLTLTAERRATIMYDNVFTMSSRARLTCFGSAHRVRRRVSKGYLAARQAGAVSRVDIRTHRGIWMSVAARGETR